MMRTTTGLSVLAGVVVLGAAALWLASATDPLAFEDAATRLPVQAAEIQESSSAGMTEAARTFLVGLDDDQRAEALFPFETDERRNWHYVPRRRRGLSLEAMSPEQRQATRALLRSALSPSGYEKAVGVVELEGILGTLSGDPGFRDPKRYWLTIFGTPSTEAPWGWRFEGHHLSLNFSSVTDSLTATTPAFLGANPATVPSGPREGWRLLADEEDLARRLFALLDTSQRERAMIATRAPRDILSGADQKVRLDRFEGLPASAMTEAQQAVLWQLIATYVGTVREDWSAERLAQLRATASNQLFFAWAGGDVPGEGHYYRIHAPTLLIEYDNTQGGANHIHTVVRDPTNDFGEDWLRQHYEATPHR